MIEGEGVHRCRCGRDYMLLDRGTRVVERLPDGTRLPYALRRPFRGWVHDKGPAASPGPTPRAAPTTGSGPKTYYRNVSDRFAFEVTDEAVRSDWGDFKEPVPLSSITYHEVRWCWGAGDELLSLFFAVLLGLAGLLFLCTRSRPVDIPTWVVMGGFFLCLVLGGALLTLWFFIYGDQALFIVTADGRSGVLLRSLQDPMFLPFLTAFEQALADRHAPPD